MRLRGSDRPHNIHPLDTLECYAAASLGQQIMDLAQALKVSENFLRDFIPVALRRRLGSEWFASIFLTLCPSARRPWLFHYTGCSVAVGSG